MKTEGDEEELQTAFDWNDDGLDDEDDLRNQLEPFALQFITLTITEDLTSSVSGEDNVTKSTLKIMLFNDGDFHLIGGCVVDLKSRWLISRGDYG